MTWNNSKNTGRNERGSRGQWLVENSLRKKGFVVIDRNVRASSRVDGSPEMDIVAKKGGALYFFEVKTRAMAHDEVWSYRQRAGFERLARILSRRYRHERVAGILAVVVLSKPVSIKFFRAF